MGRVPEGTEKTGGLLGVFFWTRCARRCASLQRTKAKETGGENEWARGRDSKPVTDFSGWSGAMMNCEGSTPAAQGTAGARPSPSSQRVVETEREGDERRLGCACLFSSICCILDMVTLRVSSMRHEVNAPSALWGCRPSRLWKQQSQPPRVGQSAPWEEFLDHGNNTARLVVWLGTTLIVVSLSAKPRWTKSIGNEIYLGENISLYCHYVNSDFFLTDITFCHWPRCAAIIEEQFN